MTWAKLSDDFWCHPKIAGLSDRAFRLHVNAICWSAALETDGIIDPGILPALRGTQAAVRALERAGLWERVDGGWSIHDFLKYNPSRASLDERRSRRAQAGRMGAARRWQEPPSAHGTSHSLSIGGGTSTAMAPGMASGMANAMANAMPDATDGAMPGAMTMSMHPYPIPIPYPECDSSSLRSSSSHSARGTRAADDDRSPPSTDDWLDAPDEPPEVREIRDLVLMALPRKYAADPLTFDEASQLGRDFAGAHELVAAAIAECRRRQKLPFPRTIRGIIQEARRDDSPRDDPILAQLRAIGALVE